MLFLVVVFLVAACPCKAVETEDNSTTLHLISQTDQQVVADFFDNHVLLGIALTSTDRSLLVTTMNGEMLVRLDNVIYEDGEDLDRLVEIKGQFFLDHRRGSEKVSYSITKKEANELMEAAGTVQDSLHGVSRSKDPLQNKEQFLLLLNQVLNLATTKMETIHNEALRTAVTNLLDDPHTPLIINAAITMGEKEGIIGSENPPVMRFYGLAKILATLTDDRTLLEYKQGNRNPKAFCDSYRECFYTCPPCKSSNCIGMCGRLCQCWEWMCCTCCWQRGCCIHDACCDKFGFYSVPCLLPFHFTCNSYSC